MRLPLTQPIDSRSGESEKDARLTNVLAEQEEGGPIATVRPGLVDVAVAETVGKGNGIVCFNGELVSVFGANLGVGLQSSAGGLTEESYFYTLASSGHAAIPSIAPVADLPYDFAQSPL